jgi:hypothetical protein
MKPEERSVMEKNVAYWTDKAEHGIALAFGPVMDPKGVYGIGVYKVKDGAEMAKLLDNDPAKGLLQYEYYPMAQAIIGKAHT